MKERLLTNTEPIDVFHYFEDLTFIPRESGNEMEVSDYLVNFAKEHGLDFTDDCQLVEAINHKVYMTEGDYTNLKITTPEDIAIAEILLHRKEEEA